ncbi:FAD-dependent oxidoreductase, partial [Streptomyces albidoflavus]
MSAPHPLPGRDASYWMATAPGPERPPLTDDIEVDVAVVGGGIAGLSTAWELSLTGRSVAVLEAGRLAAGVTGFTTAKISALHSLVYDPLRRSHGAETARHYAASQQDAVDHLARTVAGLDIDCDFERAPAYTYAAGPAPARAIEAEAPAAPPAGLPGHHDTHTRPPK